MEHEQNNELQQSQEPKYTPRPKYQIILAWVLLVIVIVGVILWLLEIGTSGKLFGLLG